MIPTAPESTGGLDPSRGDPLHPANLANVLALLTPVRHECPGKDIWCWTGYRLEELSPAHRWLHHPYP